jgi:hypothetical protein
MHAPAAAQAGLDHTLRVASVTGLQGAFVIAQSPAGCRRG